MFILNVYVDQTKSGFLVYLKNTLLMELPLWKLESWWIPECLESNCKGQNPMDWEVLYIIWKILKLKCLKWACMTHLDIWNISYGQKKGRESNW
jgi:hypothetical protein